MRRAPAFWWRSPPTPLALLLAPLGAIVGAVAARRMARPGARAGVPVVCVGNFVVGGAGKTPTALALAQLLLDAGERPFFLSRGYGGAAGAVPVLVDAQRHAAAEVGDEPLLLARVAPTIVARDRKAGADLAVASGASAIVMDDGLQSRALAPDLAVAVVDGAAGVGNGLCLPAGPLRVPLAAQLRQVDLVVIVGPGAAGQAVAAAARAAAVPCLAATLVPEAAAVARLNARPVLAFAGLGRPEKFFATLAAAGIEARQTAAFPDHHRYAGSEIAALERRAAAEGLTLVTTEKDAVRLPPGTAAQVLPVRLAFDGAAIGALVVRALARGRGTG